MTAWRGDAHCAPPPTRTASDTHSSRFPLSCRSHTLVFPQAPRKRNVVNEERARKLAEIDERLERCRLPRPRDIMQYANFRPKNPDVVAFNPTLGYFRFSEVKRGADRPHQNQLNALGLLHVITGAPVAVTRVVNGRTEIGPRSFVAEFAYEGPSWHVSWGGLSWFDDDGGPHDPWPSSPA